MDRLIEFVFNNIVFIVIALGFLTSLFSRRNGEGKQRRGTRGMPPFGGGGDWMPPMPGPVARRHRRHGRGPREAEPDAVPQQAASRPEIPRHVARPDVPEREPSLPEFSPPEVVVPKKAKSPDEGRSEVFREDDTRPAAVPPEIFRSEARRLEMNLPAASRAEGEGEEGISLEWRDAIRGSDLSLADDRYNPGVDGNAGGVGGEYGEYRPFHPSELSAREAVQGMIWAEIFGPPRAKRPFRQTRETKHERIPFSASREGYRDSGF